MRNTIIIALAAATAAVCMACSTAPQTDRAFSHGWAREHQRSASDSKKKNEKVYILGTEVKAPEWLDRDDRGRPELRLGVSKTNAMALSVNRESLGIRYRWGGGNNDLPPPPGYDERGKRSSTAREEPSKKE